MVEAEDDAVGQPVPPAEHAFHFWQKDASKQQLLAEHSVEDAEHDEEAKYLPGALERLPSFIRGHQLVEAVLLRLRPGTGKRHPKGC